MAVHMEFESGSLSGKFDADNANEAAVVIAILGLVGTGFMLAWRWAAAHWPLIAGPCDQAAELRVVPRSELPQPQ